MTDIKVMVADDHSLVRQGIKKVLELEPTIRVIGETTNGKDTISLAKKLQPDIILMDINMPQINGIEATKIIKKEMPHIKVLVLTIHDDEEYVYETVRSGASGYLLKDVDPGKLVESILRIYEGKSIIHHSVAAKLMQEFNRLSNPAKDAAVDLTSREQDVLKLIAQGCSNKEIASKLFISEKTVKNHVYNIFRKIDVSDRTQAALYAVRNNMVKL